MQIDFNNQELSFMFGMVERSKTKLAATNPKPHEENGKILAVLNSIEEKLKWTISLPKNEGPVTLNRVEAKLLRNSLEIAENMLKLAKEQYEKLDESDTKFKDENGRRKADYVNNININCSIVNGTRKKIEAKL